MAGRVTDIAGPLGPKPGPVERLKCKRTTLLSPSGFCTVPCLPEHLTCVPSALLRLGVWLASLGDKAPEVLSTLMDMLAKGVIRPHNGMIACTLASTVVRHTWLANIPSQRCFSCSAHAKTHLQFDPVFSLVSVKAMVVGCRQEVSTGAGE